ncbi:MAG: YjgP/YjgQ family permease [Nitrospirae bacterium]|nr:YjgP/YjgQ family permease [Nitrospirota bacterium]
MLTIQRLYIKEFFKLMSLIGTSLASIFSILDFIDKIDEFIPGRPTMKNLLLYIVFNFPKYLLYLLPVALLTCSLFIFSQAARNKEFVAIKAAGCKLKAVFYPFLISGVLITIFAFFVGEIIVPDFSRRSNELKNTIKNKSKDRKFMFKEGTLWLRATDGSPVRIELYVHEMKIAKGLSIFVFNENFLRERIEAEEAKWEYVQGSKGVWRLKNAIVYNIMDKKINIFPEFDYPYLESPDFFNEGIKKSEEMGIGELYRYIERLERAGFKNKKLIVDMNSKVAYPLINMFMILLGISLSIKSKFSGSLFAAGLGLLISIFYWIVYTLALSMGYAGIVEPAIAAWIVPISFGVVTIFLFKNIKE